MTTPAHDPYAALRHPGYRHYLAGNFLFNVGRQALNVAAAWQIYQWTNSATALGLVGLVNILPLFAFVLPAGVLADRFDRRLIIMRSTAVSTVLSVALAAIAFNHERIPRLAALQSFNDVLHRIALFFERHADPGSLRFDQPALPLVYLLLALLTVTRVLAGPSRGAIIPLLIPPAALGNGISWSASMFELSTVVGPALGGLIVAYFGYAAVYLFDVGTSLALAVLLLGVKLNAPTVVRSRSATGMFAGVGFMWRNPTILAAMALDLFAVVLGGATALLPIFADQILHVGPAGLGWLRAAPAAGAICMALFTAHRPSARRPGLLMLWSVAGFGAAMGLFSISTVFWLSLLALFLSGAFDNYSVIVRHSLVQLMTPDALRGRVTAVNQLFIGSSNDISALRAGLSAALFGPVLATGVGGLATIAVTGVIAMLVPALQRVPPLHQIEVESEEDDRPV